MKPFSAELKIAFAVVTLFLGWLLAIMIPQNATTARDWEVRKFWSADSASKSWYLDGQGELLGKVPQAEVETDFARLVQNRDAADFQLKSSEEIASRTNKNYAVFDPKTKTIVGDSALAKSKTAQDKSGDTVSGKPDAKRSDAQDATIASNSLAPGEATQWQTEGKNIEKKQEDLWRKEVTISVPKVPDPKPGKVPVWNDKVATAPPITGSPASARAAADAKSVVDHNIDHNINEKQSASASKAKSTKPLSDIVVRQGDKIADSPQGVGVTGSFTPIVVATKDKSTPDNAVKESTTRKGLKSKADVPASLSIAAALPDGTKTGSDGDTAVAVRALNSSPENIPEVQPLAAAKLRESQSQTSAFSSNAANTRSARPIVASGRLVVDPSTSGKAWVPPRTGKPISASLIRSDIPPGPPTIIPANHSTPISKTVGRFPGEVRFGEAGEERILAPQRSQTASRPSSDSVKIAPALSSPGTAVALPSRIQPVRVLDVTRPELFARSRGMDRTQYARFYEYNKHKLDPSGAFPAQTLLFVPD